MEILNTYLDARSQIIFDLGFKPENFNTLKGFASLVWDANNELNLMSRQMTVDDFVDNHIIDSLLPLKYFPQNIKKVADFGTGGGFPAILYAIQFPEIEFHLFEKSPLKQQYLRHCQRLIKNIQIQGLIPNDFINFDLVTSRAFKPIDVTLDISRKYASQNGKYFLLKGKKEKIEEELLASKKLFPALEFKVIPLTSPVLEVERHLVTNLN